MHKIMYQKNITINVEISMVIAWKIFQKVRLCFVYMKNIHEYTMNMHA